MATTTRSLPRQQEFIYCRFRALRFLCSVLLLAAGMIGCMFSSGLVELLFGLPQVASIFLLSWAFEDIEAEDLDIIRFQVAHREATK